MAEVAGGATFAAVIVAIGRVDGCGGQGLAAEAEATRWWRSHERGCRGGTGELYLRRSETGKGTSSWWADWDN